MIVLWADSLYAYLHPQMGADEVSGGDWWQQLVTTALHDGGHDGSWQLCDETKLRYHFALIHSCDGSLFWFLLERVHIQFWWFSLEHGHSQDTARFLWFLLEQGHSQILWFLLEQVHSQFFVAYCWNGYTASFLWDIAGMGIPPGFVSFCWNNILHNQRFHHSSSAS